MSGGDAKIPGFKYLAAVLSPHLHVPVYAPGFTTRPGQEGAREHGQTDAHGGWSDESQNQAASFARHGQGGQLNMGRWTQGGTGSGEGGEA